MPTPGKPSVDTPSQKKFKQTVLSFGSASKKLSKKDDENSAEKADCVIIADDVVPSGQTASVKDKPALNRTPSSSRKRKSSDPKNGSADSTPARKRVKSKKSSGDCSVVHHDKEAVNEVSSTSKESPETIPPHATTSASVSSKKTLLDKFIQPAQKASDNDVTTSCDAEDVVVIEEADDAPNTSAASEDVGSQGDVSNMDISGVAEMDTSAVALDNCLAISPAKPTVTDKEEDKDLNTTAASAADTSSVAVDVNDESVAISSENEDPLQCDSDKKGANAGKSNSQDSSNSSGKAKVAISAKKKEMLEQKEERKRQREEKRKEKEERKKEREEKRKDKEEKLKEREEKKKDKEEKRKEREEKERLRREEKEAKERAKLEEREKREEERQLEKERKEAEKLKQQEIRDHERLERQKLREEEKKRKQLEQNESTKKKRDEEKKCDDKKQKQLSSMFASFFKKPDQMNSCSPKVESRSAKQKAKTGPFVPFQIKKNMRLAPAIRRPEVRIADTSSAVDDALADCVTLNYLRDVKRDKRFCSATWPGPKHDDCVIVDGEKKPWRRAKFLQFHENYRPAYYGTWRKRSKTVTSRKYWAKDQTMDYEVDSDDEWEEEEPGEDIVKSDGEEEEEKEKAGSDEEEDDGFFVPHGYLSDDEGANDDEAIDPEKKKLQQAMRAKAFEVEMQKQMQSLQVIAIGPCWNTKTLPDELRNMEMIVLNEDDDLDFNSDDDDDYGFKDKGLKSQGRVPSDAMPDLVRFLHGNWCNLSKLLAEFREFWRLKCGGTPLKARSPPQAESVQTPASSNITTDSTKSDVTTKNVADGSEEQPIAVDEDEDEKKQMPTAKAEQKTADPAQTDVTSSTDTGKVSVEEADDKATDKKDIDNEAEKTTEKESIKKVGDNDNDDLDDGKGLVFTISKRQLAIKIREIAVFEKRPKHFSNKLWYVKDAILEKYEVMSLPVPTDWNWVSFVPKKPKSRRIEDEKIAPMDAIKKFTVAGYKPPPPPINPTPAKKGLFHVVIPPAPHSAAPSQLLYVTSRTAKSPLKDKDVTPVIRLYGEPEARCVPETLHDFSITYEEEEEDYECDVTVVSDDDQDVALAAQREKGNEEDTVEFAQESDVEMEDVAEPANVVTSSSTVITPSAGMTTRSKKSSLMLSSLKKFSFLDDDEPEEGEEKLVLLDEESGDIAMENVEGKPVDDVKDTTNELNQSSSKPLGDVTNVMSTSQEKVIADEKSNDVIEVSFENAISGGL